MGRPRQDRERQLRIRRARAAYAALVAQYGRLQPIVPPLPTPPAPRAFPHAPRGTRGVAGGRGAGQGLPVGGRVLDGRPCLDAQHTYTERGPLPDRRPIRSVPLGAACLPARHDRDPICCQTPVEDRGRGLSPLNHVYDVICNFCGAAQPFGRLLALRSSSQLERSACRTVRSTTRVGVGTAAEMVACVLWKVAAPDRTAETSDEALMCGSLQFSSKSKTKSIIRCVCVCVCMCACVCVCACACARNN